MRTTFTLLTAVILIAGVANGIAAEQHVKAALESNGSSGVTGFVQIDQLPHGGSNLTVQAFGLHPGTVYSSFYYESSNCTEPADLLGTFTANASGEGQVNGKIDDDLDEVGSVSVRLGPGYGALQACARIH